MPPLPLQAEVCSAGASGVEHLLNFEFIKAMTCTYASSVGFLVMGLLVYGAVGMSIYIRTGSVVIPFVLLLLTGGAVTTQLAGVAMGIVTLVLLLTGAGVVTYLYARLGR